MAVVVLSAGCSAPARSTAPPPRPAPTPATPAPMCLGQPPADWPSLLTTRRLSTPAASFGLGTVVGTTAFGQVTQATGSGIGRVDLDSGRPAS